MDIEVFITSAKEFEEKARVQLKKFAMEQLSDREYGRCNIYDFDLSGFSEDGISFSTEYNDSCHCHPEYQKAYVTVPWSAIKGGE